MPVVHELGEYITHRAASSLAHDQRGVARRAQPILPVTIMVVVERKRLAASLRMVVVLGPQEARRLNRQCPVSWAESFEALHVEAHGVRSTAGCGRWPVLLGPARWEAEAPKSASSRSAASGPTPGQACATPAKLVRFQPRLLVS